MMELKALTKAQYDKLTGNARWGRMQGIVVEFDGSDMEYCEVLNPHLSIASFQASFNSATKKMGVRPRARIVDGRLFLYKGNDKD